MKKVILAILDGVGLSNEKEGNAVFQSNPKFFNACMKKFPVVALNASEKYVGLPKGQMGNSEVGHTNIGAGRIVPQTLLKINQYIENHVFNDNEILNSAFESSQKNKSNLHILGLLSDGGIHSHMEHLYAIIELTKKYKIDNIYLHIFLDGRDTEPTQAQFYLDALNDKIKKYANIHIATICGRYFAMDREQNWDRTNAIYKAVTYAQASRYNSYKDFFYSTNQTIYDEFVSPMVVFDEYKGVNENDTLLFFNFRADRMRQLCGAFIDPEFNEFERKLFDKLSVYSLTDYGAKLNALGVKPIFVEAPLKNTLSEVLTNQDKKVLKVAETTKYAHVTYFLNGGKEKPFNNEDRILIHSDNIKTFDLKPKMQAKKIANAVIKNVKKNYYDAIILNFANGDMVGHTGNLDATIKAMKYLDKQLKRIYNSTKKSDYILLITADHGNAEKLLDEKGEMWTAHTLNQVPFILCSNNYKLNQGNYSLANISPTILDIMEIKKPKEMTAKSLLKLQKDIENS